MHARGVQLGINCDAALVRESHEAVHGEQCYRHGDLGEERNRDVEKSEFNRRDIGRGRAGDRMYRAERDSRKEQCWRVGGGWIGEQMRSTIAKPDVLRLLIPSMADSIIHRFANSSNIGAAGGAAVAVALQPLRHLSRAS